jgi:hypothetical protein
MARQPMREGFSRGGDHKISIATTYYQTRILIMQLNGRLTLFRALLFIPMKIRSMRRPARRREVFRNRNVSLRQ